MARPTGTKLEIKKEYTNSSIEQVEIKTEDGKVTKVEVNVTQLGNGGGAGGAGTSITTAITNENIGDYIDLGNDIVDFKETGSTKDDWRIFYVQKNSFSNIMFNNYFIGNWFCDIIN